jgi:hypothetical protein
VEADEQDERRERPVHVNNVRLRLVLS